MLKALQLLLDLVSFSNAFYLYLSKCERVLACMINNKMSYHTVDSGGQVMHTFLISAHFFISAYFLPSFATKVECTDCPLGARCPVNPLSLKSVQVDIIPTQQGQHLLLSACAQN